MRFRFTEDSSASPAERTLDVSSYTMYLAFMAILFGLVSTIHRDRFFKRLEYALVLFVINFVFAWWAIRHTANLNSHFVALALFYITMISAPVLLLHVLLRPGTPPSTNINDIPTDHAAPIIEAQGEPTSSNPDTSNESDNNLSVIAATVSCVEPQGEGTSRNSDSNTNDGVKNNSSDTFLVDQRPIYNYIEPYISYYNGSYVDHGIHGSELGFRKTSSYVEPQDEGTSSNSDSNTNDGIEKNSSLVLMAEPKSSQYDFAKIRIRLQRKISESEAEKWGLHRRKGHKLENDL